MSGGPTSHLIQDLRGYTATRLNRHRTDVRRQLGFKCVQQRPSGVGRELCLFLKGGHVFSSRHATGGQPAAANALR
eukprot:3331720-Pleurochrysis_carterae.AAC.1